MPRSSHGFTLIELLVVIAVLAVMMTIAAPSFTALIHDTRLATASNGILAMLHFTRSEAVKRGARVTACVSSDQERCTPGSHWHGGWIVFADRNENGTREVDEPLLRVEGRRGDGVTVTGNSEARNYVSYVASGATRQTSGALLPASLILCGPEGGRQVLINAAGRPRVTNVAC